MSVAPTYSGSSTFRLPPAPPPPRNVFDGMSSFSQFPGPLQNIIERPSETQCNGTIKRTTKRCLSMAMKQWNPDVFLPMCRAHQRNKIPSSRCGFLMTDNKTCNRLMQRIPLPYFQLCPDHISHPDNPCYLLKLPIEIRFEVYRYFLPELPIHSIGYSTVSPDYRNLLHVNRQVYLEAKDLLYSTTTFVIDVRTHGIFMCGRAIYEPLPVDIHRLRNNSLPMKPKNDIFIRNFDFNSVKNYNINIVLESNMDPNHRPLVSGPQFRPAWLWDEEVEVYDIRDSLDPVIHYLKRSRGLNRLNVKLDIDTGFNWEQQQLITNAKILLEPFLKLRQVGHPCLRDIGRVSISSPARYQSKTTVFAPRINYGTNYMPRCVVPYIPSTAIEDITWQNYQQDWEKCLQSNTPTPARSPMYRMFMEMKKFYKELTGSLTGLSKGGRDDWLHRARVAREQDDLQGFYDVRKEMVDTWQLYLEGEEAKKNILTNALSKMLDGDPAPLDKQTVPAGVPVIILEDDDEASTVTPGPSREESRQSLRSPGVEHVDLTVEYPLENAATDDTANSTDNSNPETPACLPGSTSEQSPTSPRAMNPPGYLYFHHSSREEHRRRRRRMEMLQAGQFRHSPAPMPPNCPPPPPLPSTTQLQIEQQQLQRHQMQAQIQQQLMLRAQGQQAQAQARAQAHARIQSQAQALAQLQAQAQAQAQVQAQYPFQQVNSIAGPSRSPPHLHAAYSLFSSSNATNPSSTNPKPPVQNSGVAYNPTLKNSTKCGTANTRDAESSRATANTGPSDAAHKGKTSYLDAIHTAPASNSQNLPQIDPVSTSSTSKLQTFLDLNPGAWVPPTALDDDAESSKWTMLDGNDDVPDQSELRELGGNKPRKGLNLTSKGKGKRRAVEVKGEDDDAGYILLSD